jgi:hypothetical protein
MTWMEPKTDWSGTDRVTSTDMNRICSNLNVIYPEGKLKDDYTENDFVTISQWQQILTSLQTMLAVTGIRETIPGDEMTCETFSQVESLTLEIRNQILYLLDQTKASSYSGDLVYAAETYAAGY